MTQTKKPILELASEYFSLQKELIQLGKKITLLNEYPDAFHRKVYAPSCERMNYCNSRMRQIETEIDARTI